MKRNPSVVILIPMVLFIMLCGYLLSVSSSDKLGQLDSNEVQQLKELERSAYTEPVHVREEYQIEDVKIKRDYTTVLCKMYRQNSDGTYTCIARDAEAYYDPTSKSLKMKSNVTGDVLAVIYIDEKPVCRTQTTSIQKGGVISYFVNGLYSSAYAIGDICGKMGYMFFPIPIAYPLRFLDNLEINEVLDYILSAVLAIIVVAIIYGLIGFQGTVLKSIGKKVSNGENLWNIFLKVVLAIFMSVSIVIEIGGITGYLTSGKRLGASFFSGESVIVDLYTLDFRIIAGSLGFVQLLIIGLLLLNDVLEIGAKTDVIDVVKYTVFFLLIPIMIYAYIIALAMLVFNIVIVGMAGGGFDDNDSPNTTNKKTTSEDDWYSRRRVVRDKYGREYKVGRSGDYVERSGQWYRVSRDGEGNPYIDDDNYDGDLCDKNNGRLH